MFYVLGHANPVVTVAALSRRSNGELAAMGFAADVTIHKAALSALSELFQMEASCALANHRRRTGKELPSDQALFLRAEAVERLLASDPPADREPDEITHAELSLHEILERLPDEIWFASYSSPDLPIHVARALSKDRLRTRPLKFGADGGPV